MDQKEKCNPGDKKSSCTERDIIYNDREMIKKLTLCLGTIATLIGISGCTATATVGKTANPPWVDASVTKDGVDVTLPFVKAGVGHEK